MPRLIADPERTAFIGVSDHGGWAIFVTVGHPGNEILDRRRVELVDDALPALPHHHEAQMLSPEEGVALVERVRASAERYAIVALDAVHRIVPRVAGVALRALQPLPPTISERLTDHRARNVADWVMYRSAIVVAANTRGWRVYWFDSKTVLHAAARRLNVADFEAHFRGLRNRMGPPWNNDQKIAMAAGIVATK